MANIDIIVTGRVAGVVTLDKQLKFAVKRTVNDLLDVSQRSIIRGLKKGLHIRTHWTDPKTRFGINVSYAKQRNMSTLEGSVYTAADWLLEEEGYNSGVKKAEHKPNRAGHISQNLSVPNIGHARPSLMAIMPASQKAGKLLANTKRSKAFKVRSKRSGKEIVLQRVGVSSSGALLRDSRGNYRIGRKKERASTQVVLKAVIERTVRVPEKMIFVRTAKNVMNEAHYVSLFGKNLLKALNTAKMPGAKKNV